MMDVTTERVTLLDGSSIPRLGLGVYKVDNDTVQGLVEHALSVGYRLIDTAAMYDNEEGVGRAVARSDVPRSEIQIATKFWMDGLGYENTLAAAKSSLHRMNLEYLDLYLIHWPAPARGLFVESWRAMQQLKADGLVRSIGVCNFHTEHIDAIVADSGEAPVLNQVELHPWLTQEPLREYHKKAGILTQAWSPLARGQVLQEPALQELAGEYGVSVAQLVVRWHLDNGVAVIPKSNSPARITENADVFGFTLSEEHRSMISALNKNYRTGVDPNDRN